MSTDPLGATAFGGRLFLYQILDPPQVLLPITLVPNFLTVRDIEDKLAIPLPHTKLYEE